jgi:N-acetylglucosaminyldiphosphoundecaprenol N-acetyl-beta-D-mannosaminyltransferase
LEWLFRLATEPKRLYRRYLFVVPRYLWFFVGTLIRAVFRLLRLHRKQLYGTGR